ncbi:hypothetical protein Tco_1040949 [Tanacetum coccineum]|uniref:Uncharacterized protein n=1 Tax=Tanacetum coccineum TaxID=301880 RepID=A0ABQ5GGI4_9ASTR
MHLYVKTPTLPSSDSWFVAVVSFFDNLIQSQQDGVYDSVKLDIHHTRLGNCFGTLNFVGCGRRSWVLKAKIIQLCTCSEPASETFLERFAIESDLGCLVLTITVIGIQIIGLNKRIVGG